MKIKCVVECNSKDEIEKIVKILEKQKIKHEREGDRIEFEIQSPAVIMTIYRVLSNSIVETMKTVILSNNYGDYEFAVNEYMKFRVMVSDNNVVVFGTLYITEPPTIFSVGSFKKEDVDKVVSLYREFREDFENAIKKYIIDRIETYALFKMLPEEFSVLFGQNSYVKLGNKIVLVQDIPVNKDKIPYWTAIWKDEFDNYNIKSSVVGSLVRKGILKTLKISGYQLYMPSEEITKRLSKREVETYNKMKSIHDKKVEIISKYLTGREKSEC